VASLSGLSRLGIEVDDERNADVDNVPRNIAADGASVAVLVIPTNEEWEIARQSLEVVDAG
jgi:acetate kinase